METWDPIGAQRYTGGRWRIRSLHWTLLCASRTRSFGSRDMRLP